MSYAREREEFIARICSEGLPFGNAQLLLRYATTINRLAELACSSEAADRDRIPCPAARTYTKTVRGELRTLPRKPSGPCLCDDYPVGSHAAGQHFTIPRITLQDYQSEQRAKKAVPAGWTVITEGDPRGYTLRVVPPSYAQRNEGKDRHNLDAIGVPPGPSGLRF